MTGGTAIQYSINLWDPDPWPYLRNCYAQVVGCRQLRDVCFMTRGREFVAL